MDQRVALRLFVLDEHSCSSLIKIWLLHDVVYLLYALSTVHCSSKTNILIVA